MSLAPYPETASNRTRWIVEKRGPRNELPEDQPYAFFLEQERTEQGNVADTATIFLTNRECPWKCLMCDLWRNTRSGAPGMIPRQIEFALKRLPRSSVIKLYNSGSFFDPGAIPRSDWDAIAFLCREFHHVIVECHPRLVGPSVSDFARRLAGSLEVAMGLETCHPDALLKLNKRITPADFRAAARELRTREISVRTFLLVGVPFVPASEQSHWVEKSIEFAFTAGSNVVSLIPTRLGNGALDAVRELGEFREPNLTALEQAHEFGVRLGRGRVFADTWDIERFANCKDCAPLRRARIQRMNLSRQIEPRISCSSSCAN